MRLAFIFFLWSNLYFSTAQGQEFANNKWSPFTHQFIKAYKAGALPQGYVYKEISGAWFVSAMIKTNNHFAPEEWIAKGVWLGTKAGPVYTMQIPVAAVQDVLRLKGYDYFMLDEPIHSTLDSARKKTRVDSVYLDNTLPALLNGKDVVVGILDIGFDYTHPVFYDTSYASIRIKRLWQQRGVGTPPAGYAYGAELTDTNAMKAQQYDALESHGTHVAGIASGGGFVNGDNAQNRGVAWGADLVLVGITPPATQWTTTGMTDIIDGANYVYQYAQSVGKPAVVNLSWGCTIGSHDGLSLFSIAMDNLVGAGKIFCLSAGNNGSNNIHLSKNLTSTDSTLSSFITFSTAIPERKTWLDVWGDSAKNYCIQYFLWDNVAGTKIDSSSWLCTTPQTGTLYLKGAANDTCIIRFTSADASFNGKPRLFADIHSKTSLRVGFTVKANNGKAHVWMGFVQNSRGIYGSLTNNGKTWATTGNKDYTIGDMACTKRAITVGAYASKSSGYWPNTLNGIASFSSLGPTADERVKPDITAPGLVLVSGVNSFDSSFVPGGANAVLLVKNFTHNARTYYYAQLAGTSMSSPMASGIVALMLQANPTLTPEMAKYIIGNTALKDNFTGALTSPSNTWGYGKINAYAAVKSTYALLGTAIKPYKSSKINVYPNPASNLLFVESPLWKNKKANIAIVNSLGIRINTSTQTIAGSDGAFLIPIQHLTPGNYHIQITMPGQPLATLSFIKK